MIAIQTSERNGRVVSAALVEATDELMLITSGGVLIRTRVQEIREMSRATQGVTLIALDKEEKLVSLSRIPESEDEGEEDLPEAEVTPGE
jgi:DNA gyrase subunit A